MPLTGMEIRVSEYLTEPGPPVKVRRTWRERLLSGYCEVCRQSGWTMPWSPFVAFRLVDGPPVPMNGALMVGGVVYMHPATFAAFRALTAKDVRS